MNCNRKVWKHSKLNLLLVPHITCEAICKYEQTWGQTNWCRRSNTYKWAWRRENRDKLREGETEEKNVRGEGERRGHMRIQSCACWAVALIIDVVENLRRQETKPPAAHVRVTQRPRTLAQAPRHRHARSRTDVWHKRDRKWTQLLSNGVVGSSRHATHTLWIGERRCDNWKGGCERRRYWREELNKSSAQRICYV